MFLFPKKIEPNDTLKINLRTPEKQELQVFFEETNFQPIFLKNRIKHNFDYNIEVVNFHNSIGNNLYAWFLKPQKTIKTTATILFLHGNAGNILSHFSIVHPLVDKGFQILLFDYSGFGFSEGKSSRKNVLRDAQAALNYLLQRDDCKELPIVLYGQSLGGNLAAELARKNKDNTEALVIEGAFSSHDDVAAYTTKLGVIARIAVKELYASKKAIKKWNKPLLLIHSIEDSIVPFFMGERIFKNASEPKSFYSIKKPHICGPIYYTDSIAIRINTLLNKQNK